MSRGFAATLFSWRQDMAERLELAAALLTGRRDEDVRALATAMQRTATEAVEGPMRHPAIWLSGMSRRLRLLYGLSISCIGMRQTGETPDDLRQIADELAILGHEVEQLRALLSAPVVCAGGAA